MQLIGGNDPLLNPNAANRRRNAVINEDGFIVPPAMRNYVERNVCFGCIRLRKFERVDLFWGRIKDVERDFIYAHLFVIGTMLAILVYCIVHGATQDQKYFGNI